MKRWRYCAEEIQDAAGYCKHCHSSLTAPANSVVTDAAPTPSYLCEWLAKSRGSATLFIATCALLVGVPSGCDRASGVTQGGWTTAQRGRFDHYCDRIVFDIYGTPGAGREVPTPKTDLICGCVATSTQQLFPSYGAWSVAKSAARETVKKRYDEKPGVGAYSFICDDGMSQDPAFVNWCAELYDCSRATK
jgi:hypothetical protein